MTDRLSPLDQTFLLLERDGQPMHIGGLMGSPRCRRMVMKESLVSFVDSTETLAPKTARGERLAATKTAKTSFSQRFLASGGWLFCGKRPSIARTLAGGKNHNIERSANCRTHGKDLTTGAGACPPASFATGA